MTIKISGRETVGEKSVVMVAGTSALAGGERNLLDLAEAARDDGWWVGLIAPGEGKLTREARALGLPVWQAPMPRFPNPLSLLKIRRILRREAFRIVHAHGHFAGLHARLAALGLGGVRTVYTLHGIHYPHYRNQLKARAFILGERALKHFTDLFICVCDHDVRLGTELGIIDPARTAMIHNGVKLEVEVEVDASRVADLHARYDRGGGLVLHVGRFMYQKDHHTLIEAVPLVLGAHPDVIFLLAGGGELMEREKRFAESLGIPAESLVFLGETDAVDELLAACDFLVLPSLWEGFPYIVLESMRAGRAVIATATGGTPEAVVHGENGLLIGTRDPGALAAAVNRFLDHPEEAAAMGRRGRELVRRFDLEATTKQTLEAYARLLREG